ncbi:MULTISPECIES: sugar ABC transporter permease [unclassified Brenneria]|uniref:carbohydrate ABC transporter permease n=1 Tax=unclassified Brenneria TaxID=2634434 RepID=UPI0029C14909|nr:MULTISPECIES: sugar ABC transporter permease [unclassified Brenneria]MDX5628206.1 sugar ABC transporter permease [Brenneria sp. L3-3Z]MDX5695611.1 sugar ABC transporter permease [Brenneria sp. L4-2C]MEE3662460.1 sugar ABC transporter permease [Brenneria sp. g21c3]
MPLKSAIKDNRSALPDAKAEPTIEPMHQARRKLFFWFVAPALVLYVVLFILPTIATVWISFHKWPGAGPMEYVGWRNYEALYYDPIFISAFINTLKIIFIVGGATFFISFAMTMALREMMGRKFVRSVIFFPNILSAVVISILWGFLFQSGGLVNEILAGMGISNPPAWLNESNLFNLIMVGLIWVSTGFYTTILMAGVDRIPADLYEEAELAGANALQRFWHITLPLMWEIVSMAAVLWTISSVKIFEFIYAFAGGAGYLPSTKVWNTALYSYAEAFAATGTPRYGPAAASAFIMLILVAVLVWLIRRIMRRDPLQF